VDSSVGSAGPAVAQMGIGPRRIEPGTIECQLLQHPHVKCAAVLAWADESGDTQLMACVEVKLPERSSLPEGGYGAAAGLVDRWNKLYELTYSTGPAAPSFVGWTSSYTRQPIPEDDMREWLQGTVDRLRALRPQKILEIGCGSGLVLQHLAPQCVRYMGTDISAAALGKLRRWTDARNDLRHVELLHRSAPELTDLEPGSFDTVVLNSVVQYFPSLEYLITVLQGAVRLLAAGGRIFIGDVRHFGLLPIFHSAVQLSRAADSVTVAQLRRRARRAISQEIELTIEPQFFHGLPELLPAIRSVEVLQKQGRAANELMRYRYDVLLDTAASDRPLVSYDTLDWAVGVGRMAELKSALQQRRWRAVRLSSVPNPRLMADLASHAQIEIGAEQEVAGTLRRRVSELRFDAIDLELLQKWGDMHDYDIVTTWAAAQVPGCLDIHLFDRTRFDRRPRVARPLELAAIPWRKFANDPLGNSMRQQMIPGMRAYLKAQLPEHVIPSDWIVLE
jgi:polyketide synthase PksJ